MNLFPIAPAVIDIDSRIRNLYDHLYANSNKRTPAGIALETGKVLHAAQYIEEARQQVPAFDFDKQESKLLMKGVGDLVKHVAKTVRSSFAEMNSEWSLYDPSAKIDFRDSDIAYIAAQLSGVHISDRKRDVFGDAVEIFRSQWAKREGGMFFTDQRVTHLAMELLSFDPMNGDDLIDICAGTGGFLSAGLNRIRQILDQETNKNVEKQVARIAAMTIRGCEIDSEVARVANATLASRTGQTDHLFVQIGDSIAPESFCSDQPRNIREGAHLCAASNPPFGTKTTIKDERVLSTYELARTTSRGFRNGTSGVCFRRPPDILLLERNVRLLKPGVGRLAIVLPYQLLSGPQTHFVREWLLRNTELLAVVDLPPETFQPHTGTKTSLLVLRRRLIPLTEAKPQEGRRIFMATPRWIGHDRRGKPVYQRSADGRQSDQILSDFDLVEAAFASFCKGGDPSAKYEQTFAVDEETIFRDPALRINALYHQPRHNVPLTFAPNKWTVVRLGDVVSRIFFPTRFKRCYVDQCDGAVPFFGGSNITEFIVNTSKWLSADDRYLEELRVKAGWILVTRSGSTGIVASVPPAWDGVAMSEHVIRIIPNTDKMPGEYLQAFLRTPQAQDALARSVFGSVIDEINPEAIGALEVPVPKKVADLDRIVISMRNAEQARQQAIEGLFGAVDVLAKMITPALRG